MCLVTVSVYSGVPREGSGSSSSSASYPTESSDSSELLSSPSSGAEAITRSQWEELASLSPFVCSASRGVMVRKSTLKRTIISTRRAGLSFFPAYLIAVIRASISSVTVSPRPRIISFVVFEKINKCLFIPNCTRKRESSEITVSRVLFIITYYC